MQHSYPHTHHLLRHWLMRCCARMLMMAYTLLMLKPAMPVIADAVAHTLWKSVHVSVVHKVAGKEHVHYELRKAAADTDKDKSGLKGKGAAEDLYHLAAFTAVRVVPRPVLITAKAATYFNCTYEDASSAIESPPPRKV